MSDDWVEKYMDLHNQRQREKQDARARRSLAEGAAPEKFSQIRRRIEQDVQAFRGVVAFQALEVRAMSSSGKFQVFYPFPRVTLDMGFDAILVKYEYAFSPKEGSMKSRVERKPGTLRICSDLDGCLTVYRNGDGEAFVDDSEISEFLLKPILDYTHE